MRSTGTHRHDRGRQGSYGSYAPRGAPMYYGWSHDESRMQMMDLPDYLDSFRLGYERALGDLQNQLASLTQAYTPTGNVMYGGGPAGYAPAGPYQPQPGRRGQYHGGHHPHHDHDCGCECHDHHDHGHHDHGHHDHGYHDHHGHGCGCGHYDDCRCDCCIVDADYVVYARCLERRLVPIQIENDTRKARDDVTLEVSDVRSSGGRVLPWKVRVNPQSPITLAPCSTTEIDLLVEIDCSDKAQQPEPQQTPGRQTAAQKAAAAKEADAAEDAQRAGDVEPVDVDGCEVGYVTIRVGGCIVRPIVVAIAVLPRDCDAYHASCSCGCC